MEYAIVRTVRVERRRQAGARLPAGCRYAGRPTLLGNPWRGPGALTAYERFLAQVFGGVLCRSVIEEGLDVDCYFARPIDAWQELRELLFALRRDPPAGLACWCPLTRACHVDLIIAALAMPLPHLAPARRLVQQGDRRRG